MCITCSQQIDNSEIQNIPSGVYKARELQATLNQDVRNFDYPPKGQEQMLRGQSIDEEEIPCIFKFSSSKQVNYKQLLHEVRNKVRIIKRDPLEFYEIVSNIAEGSSGVIYLSTLKESGNMFVLKRFKISNQEERDRATQEIYIMMFAQHPNIVNIFECYQNKE